MSAVYQNGKDFSSREANFNDFRPEGVLRSNKSACVSARSGTTELTPYVIIYQSEIESIVGQSVPCSGIETGGELYGLLSHAGRPVIMYATPAGRNAIEERALFQQDIEFFRKSNAYLWENFALQFAGTWHDHHDLSLKRLSPQDIHSTHRIASRNGYLRLCQILLTNEAEVSIPNNGRFIVVKPKSKSAKNRGFSNVVSRLKPGIKSHRHPQSVRVHAFIYRDPAHGQPIRCPIKVIPGVSPIRQAISQNCEIPELRQTYTFPMARILYDCFEEKPKINDYCDQKLPKRIYKQCLQLPEKVRDGARVTFRDGFLVISLPISSGGMMFVAYGLKKRHRVRAVYFSKDKATDELINLTDVAVCYGPYTNLETIFNRGIRFVCATDCIRHQSYQKT